MQALDESDFELPEGYEIVIGGDAENSSEAMGNLCLDLLCLCLSS